VNGENKIHGRQAMKGLGATIAAVAVTPAFASWKGLVNQLTWLPCMFYWLTIAEVIQQIKSMVLQEAKDYLRRSPIRQPGQTKKVTSTCSLS
jgi:hypothetical protein